MIKSTLYSNTLKLKGKLGWNLEHTEFPRCYGFIDVDWRIMQQLWQTYFVGTIIGVRYRYIPLVVIPPLEFPDLE